MEAVRDHATVIGGIAWLISLDCRVHDVNHRIVRNIITEYSICTNYYRGCSFVSVFRREPVAYRATISGMIRSGIKVEKKGTKVISSSTQIIMM